MNSEDVAIIVNNQMMTSPNLHDAEILSISPLLLNSEWQLKITVSLDSTEKYELDFSNVTNLICNHMGFQNVIDNVVVLSQDRILNEIDKYKVIFGADSYYLLKEFVSELKEKNLFLVQFSPSTGAEIIILCNNMKVSLLR